MNHDVAGTTSRPRRIFTYYLRSHADPGISGGKRSGPISSFVVIQLYHAAVFSVKLLLVTLIISDPFHGISDTYHPACFRVLERPSGTDDSPRTQKPSRRVFGIEEVPGGLFVMHSLAGIYGSATYESTLSTKS